MNNSQHVIAYTTTLVCVFSTDYFTPCLLFLCSFMTESNQLFVLFSYSHLFQVGLKF